jgi:hypothetical protein
MSGWRNLYMKAGQPVVVDPDPALAWHGDTHGYLLGQVRRMITG